MEKTDDDRSLMRETMDKCAILYCNKSLPMTQSLCCFGWECGKGWFDVLHEASCKLEALNLAYYPNFKVRIQADQVKEKFGTLRFYFSVVCDDADHSKEQDVVMTAMESWANEIVRWAEDQCFNTCEDCGRQIGTDWSPRCETMGWITYLCDECAAKKTGFYYKNGEKWQGDKCLMTKEEVEAEHKKHVKELEESCRRLENDLDMENTDEDKN